MRFCSLKFQNLVRKIDLVNRRWVVYSRAYGKLTRFSLTRGRIIRELVVGGALLHNSCRRWSYYLGTFRETYKESALNEVVQYLNFEQEVHY